MEKKGVCLSPFSVGHHTSRRLHPFPCENWGIWGRCQPPAFPYLKPAASGAFLIVKMHRFWMSFVVSVDIIIYSVDFVKAFLSTLQTFLLTEKEMCVILYSKGGVSMTQGERVREVRKTQGLTLEKFGERLGVGKGAISAIENNNRNLTDQMAKAICREFGVSESWLRTGEGEMIEPTTPSEHLLAYVARISTEPDKEFQIEFLTALSRMKPEQWKLVEDFLDDLIARKEKKKESE